MTLSPASPPPADAATATFQIQRMSLRYAAEQDRVRIDAVNADGGTFAMWLTRRLVRSWVKTLADWLEQSSPAAAAAPAEARTQAVAMENAIISGRRARVETPPVAPGPAPLLVAAIDLSRNNRRWTMVFRTVPQPGRQSPQAKLDSDAATVHHLAQVLVQQIRAAGWSEPLPMGWLGETTTSSPAAPGTLLN